MNEAQELVEYTVHPPLVFRTNIEQILADIPTATG